MPEPISQAPGQAVPPVAPSSPSLGTMRGPKPAAGGNSIIMSVLVVIILAALYLWYSQTTLSGFKEDWQAIFLTNGQVYFGQVGNQNSSEVIAKDIYYLQVTRPLQQTEGGESAANPQGELSLVKLGNELHGPTDKMYINRGHILFIEDLKEDSNVVTAISNYKGE